MTKQTKTLKEKVAASRVATLKPADPKAPTRVVIGGRPAKRQDHSPGN